MLHFLQIQFQHPSNLFRNGDFRACFHCLHRCGCRSGCAPLGSSAECLNTLSGSNISLQALHPLCKCCLLQARKHLGMELRRYVCVDHGEDKFLFLVKANCNANPGFRPTASGGDGAVTQFWYVGYDPTLRVSAYSISMSVIFH